MTTGAQAVERIAKATGILSATVFRAARTLREADASLWPEAGRGGGKAAAHVDPHHLVNLVLALAVADPITEAPEKVEAYGSLVRMPFPQGDPSKDDKAERTVLRALGLPVTGSPSPGFGTSFSLSGALEGFVYSLSNPLTGERLRTEALATDIEIRLVSSRNGLSANIGFKNKRIYLPFFSPQGLLPTDGINEPRQPEAPFEREVTLGAKLFIVLAELWADTRSYQASKAAAAKRRKSSSQPDSLGSAILENETAATPGREAAAYSDQPATTDLDGSQQAHPIHEEEKVHSSSKPPAGLSPPFKKE